MSYVNGQLSEKRSYCEEKEHLLTYKDYQAFEGEECRYDGVDSYHDGKLVGKKALN